MIGLKVKQVMFDQKIVADTMDKESRKALGHFGGYVRKTAISSIHDAPPTSYSTPGSPPFSHVGYRLKQLNKRRKAEGRQKVKGFKGLKYILYKYEPESKGVIIGPASNRVRSLTIPEILEEGKRGIAARPFMHPAFEAAKSRLPEFWNKK